MKFWKRILGSLLSAAAVLSCIVPASAATDVVKSYKSSTYYYISGTSSKLGYYPETIATVSQGNYTGLPAYCLEFHKTMTTGVHLKEDSQFWEALAAEGLSDSQISGVAYASIYGYPNFNYGISDTEALYIATQWIMWEYSSGYRTSADGDNPTAGLNGSFLSQYVSLEQEHQTAIRKALNDSSFDIRQRFWYAINQKGYTNIKTAYVGILNNIKNATKSPSFAGTEWTWGDTVTLKWSAANQRYEATVTDTNGLINNGWSWSSVCDNSNIKFSYSGNQMTIYTPSPLSSAATITMTKKLPTDAPTSVILINESKSSAQKILVGTFPQSEVKRYFPVQTQLATGKIQITKQSSSGQRLSGAVFTVYNDDAATSKYGTLTESSTGIYSISNVPIGTYFVKETQAPSGYALDSGTYPVTVTADKTSVVANSGTIFVNYPSVVDAPFLKVDSDGNAVAGAKLVLYDDAHKQIDAWTTTTDKHTVSGLIIGKKYTLHETEAPAGYKLADDITFTASENQAATTITMVDEDKAPIILPDTGGIGNQQFAVIGIGLMTIAALFFHLYYKRKSIQ